VGQPWANVSRSPNTLVIIEQYIYPKRTVQYSSTAKYPVYVLRMAYYILFIYICFLTLVVAIASPSQPTVTTINGTYRGLHIDLFNQDAFVGIPFAQAPIGDLRLRLPLPYNQAWSGIRSATARSDSCPGFDAPFKFGFADGLTLGEDCLRWILCGLHFQSRVVACRSLSGSTAAVG
jgi:hypothetical protein